MSVWREAQAPDSGRTYYYNTDTRQTVWERPAEMDSAAAPTTPATATPTGPAAEQLTQEHLAAGWQATKTPEGRTYYYKRGTQETSWRLPDLPDPRNQQVAGPGSFAAASWDRGSDAPPRRYDRREDRDRGLPDKPGFDGGRGKPWEQQGGGFRGAMPAKADEPDYATAEQARDAFFKVLRKHNIKYNTPWPDALRAVIREREYRAIKDAKDRKAAFEDYCIEQRVEEKSREKERHAKLREEFRAMLKTHEEIKHYTRWKTARPMIEREAVFRNAGDEDERRSLFDEYILELKKRHIDQEIAGRRRALDQLEMLVRSLVIDPNTKWAIAQDTIMTSDKFMNDDAFEPLHKLDVILAFESHLKRLEQEINHAKQADKSLQQTRDRQARDGFRSLLQEKLKAGVFTAGSKWQDFVPHIEDEERYINMIGTSGSSPLDMFWDYVEDEERKVRSKRNDALDILDEQRYEMSSDTSLDAFAEVMGRDRRTSSWTSQDMKLVFEKLMEKIHKRAEEDKALAERSQRKAVDALRSVIKHLEPPVNENDTFEDIQPKLEKYKEYQALDNEARRIAFSKHIRRLQEKAEDAERDRVRRERDRTLDRERDRDRDRDYRRSYDYDRERDRDRDRRHRTRTPEVDAYEADRRKAQADRERSFRKPSFGLTPPPRERRDDRSDRERDRGGDRDRDRRGDRYESMYERERREREAERERNYASRADPRDRGKVSTLDYGDDDVVGSRPGSIRKRRESDDVSMASKRDNKRSRQSKEPEGKPTVAEKEDVAMQSGSEEGEIEEV